MTMGRKLPDHSAMSSSSQGPNAEDARLEPLELMKRKDTLEKELMELHTALQAQNADLGQSLIDDEGFPRADIDVYNVRLSRVRVIELRNDLRGLSDKIKELLDVVFARPEPSEVDEKVIPIEEILAKPFASCNGVAPGSPAATAGLLRGDKFLRIGSINSTNHESLRAVATEVQANENRTVTIDVLRVQEGSVEETKISLVLIPKAWAGRGLLGCHIIPI
ncbi:26S proteasome non-ATPase regulatory subunit 9 [Cystobasidium minutum MCA 4210]|uniref:26S proteasome non-ATPase regulatory subunit 9 n=1 Tax=Cystobasidium minutum MCA 4210 TaxID=1397322 RepID=UPI0034CDE15A|eukprot:jgi/Rhomi1/171657/fgenesh1_kg.4_\